jgi:hypothetical protein
MSGQFIWLHGFQLTPTRPRAEPTDLARDFLPETDIEYESGGPLEYRSSSLRSACSRWKHITMDPEIVIGIDFGMTVRITT